jgi:hypothetical protein
MSRGITPTHVSLGHDHDALAWDIVLLQELAEDPLGVALGVGVCSIERLGTLSSAQVDC